MPDINSTRAHSHETFYLDVAIVWPKIDVESILDALCLGHESEQQPRRSIDDRSNLELRWVLAEGHPAQSRTPPTSEVDRRNRVDDQLLPCQTHPTKLTIQIESHLPTPPTVPGSTPRTNPCEVTARPRAIRRCGGFEEAAPECTLLGAAAVVQTADVADVGQGWCPSSSASTDLGAVSR